MPSHRSYRPYRRFYRKKKWSPVLLQDGLAFTLPPAQGGAPGRNFYNVILSANSANTTAPPTATVLKVANFRLSLDLNPPSGFQGAGKMFVVYVPEDVNVSASLPYNHPEWVMAWKTFEPGQTDPQSTITMSSRMRRNLNSGDRIVLLLDMLNFSTAPEGVQFVGAITCSYACCSN